LKPRWQEMFYDVYDEVPELLQWVAFFILLSRILFNVKFIKRKDEFYS
jgi:hypothetical protein